MKINIAIEIEVDDDSIPQKNTPSADASRMIDMLHLHSTMVVTNFYGRIVKFGVEKKLDTTP